MSEKFSPAVRIVDVNDFIGPSQPCVVSLKANATAKKLNNPKPEVAVYSKQQTGSDQPVKISLQDCLACSGCTTSAETVMLEKKSLDDFLSNINRGKATIVSLSQQSRASLAAHFRISTLQVFEKLTTFLKSLGVKAVFDVSCSRDLTLIESCDEFISRYKQSQPNANEGSNSSLPMLSSACPGWVFFAEKQPESDILSNISSVKSPQQIIGAIIKRHLCQKMGLRPDDIYHVTVMPCNDKKLEAARGDFVFEVESMEGIVVNGLRIKEVDSVLTTGEILDLIKLKEVDIESLEDSPLDKMLTNVNEEGHLYGVPGSSGGYAETVFRYAAKVLFGREIKGPLAFKAIKKNLHEVALEVNQKIVLKFAQCYGFPNLVNIVRQIKRRECDYHFVEVMACPSGCLNGGGQIKPKPGQSAEDLLQAMESVYMDNVLVADPFENPSVESLYRDWLVKPGSAEAKKHMHTKYHRVVKSITAQYSY